MSDLYSSPSIIRKIKSRRVRWAGYVAPMGEKRNAYRIFWWERSKGKAHSEDLDVCGRIILREIGWGGID
jgi:hypothetical protein